MRLKYLVYLLLVSTAFAQGLGGKAGLGGKSGIGGGGVVAISNIIGPQDFDIDGAGTTATTTVTVANLNAGTIGNANHGGWTVNGTLTWATSVSGCEWGGTPQVNGTFIATNHAALAVTLPNTSLNTNIEAAAPLGMLVYDGAICFTTPPDDGAGGSLFDKWRVVGSAGGSQYVLVQIQNGTAGGPCVSFCAEIEYINSGGTQHSATKVLLSPNTTYKAVGYVDATGSGDTGDAIVKIYDISNVQVGSTITVSDGPTADTFLKVTFGNASGHGSSTGTASFQNVLSRWNAKPVPLDPVNTTQDPVRWVAQAHGFHGSGNVTSLAASPALDEHAGDRVYVWCETETSTTSAVCTAPTNTAGETFTKVTGTETLANGQTMNVWELSVAADHASQTYTCNFSSDPFNNCHVVITKGGTATDVAANVNTASGANMTSSSFNPTTSTGLSLMCGYKQAGSVLISAGTNYYGAGGIVAQSWGCMARPNTPSGAQTAQMVHSDSAASVGALVNIKQ